MIHGTVSNSDGNTRNGLSRKTLKGQHGNLEIDIPRDRQGSFEPQLIQKRQTHWQGFDDQVISLYSRGMTVREIQGHLSELYKVDVSPSLISAITKEAATDLKEIYKAPTVQAASDALKAFEGKWGAQFPRIGKSWRANWGRLITFFKFP